MSRRLCAWLALSTAVCTALYVFAEYVCCTDGVDA